MSEEFPKLKDLINGRPIKVTNFISILAEFRYHEDCDIFCREATARERAFPWDTLYVFENDEPFAVWEDGVERIIK